MHKLEFRGLSAILVVVTATWGLSGFAMYVYMGSEERGTFGDMFGTVNALFSGLAFATLIYTAWMQREELALQRVELRETRLELQGQKHQLEEQNKTFSLQRFEDSFFSLLQAHREIVSTMSFTFNTGHTVRARDCFKVWYERLNKIQSKAGDYSRAKGRHVDPGPVILAIVQNTYREFYSAHQAELGHYFRHLYHIIKFIKLAPIQNRHFYTALVRAQLSGYEQLMLFYNCLSGYGYEKFKPLVEEFALLKNLPQELLKSPDVDVDLYSASAYGKLNRS